MDNTVVSKESFKRIVKDVKELIVDPLNEQNIYYSHDTENILKGYAMIIGPEDSCYHNGFFFFEFAFPNNYPWAPPKVIYRTNDGTTRFHPNLYRDGKVCLSLLNTWKGESWSACQSIKSVLLTILSVLNNKPLLHEPGVKSTHEDYKKYNEIITYKSYEYALLKQYLSDNNVFELFRQDMKNYIKNNIKNILKELNQKHSNIEKKYKQPFALISIKLYGFKTVIDYTKIIDEINNIKIE